MHHVERFLVVICILLVGVLGVFVAQIFVLDSRLDRLGTRIASIESLAMVAVHPTAAPKGPVVVSLDRLNLDGAPTIGEPQAPVTIVLFSDFECGFCRDFVITTFPSLKENYLDTGKARLVFKQFPLDTRGEAFSAAAASFAAQNQGRFWQFFEILGREPLVEGKTNYVQMAKEAGVADLSRFERELTTQQTIVRVWGDIADGLRVPLSGTPSFIINGALTTGTLSYPALVRLIDSATGEEASAVSGARAQRLIEDKTVQIVDVRTPAEYAEGHLSNALSMDVSSADFVSQARRMDREKAYLLYCKSGTRSQRAYQLMEGMGFRSLYVLDGGIDAWTAENRPLVKGSP